MSELEATVKYLKSSATKNRKNILWFCAAGLLLLLVIEVREVATLLLAAYTFAILLDPLVTCLEERKIPRSFSIITIGVLVVLLTLGFMLLAIPPLLREYRELIQYLPEYLHTVAGRINGLLQSWLGVSAPLEELADDAKEYVAALGVDQIKTFGQTLGRTLLRGYSFALTIVNLCLLPFFVFYIARDLQLMHKFLGGFFEKDTQSKISTIGGEILGHVYAFFKGQLTVCGILAVLYIVGLSLVGLPWAIIVGALTGLLNIIPYLGVAIGLILASVITLVTDPSLTQFLMVFCVFIVIQAFEGSFITPKIVGESMGIHPLGVMLALIVGGELFGLLGLIIAIPAAASIRVLCHHIYNASEH